MNKQNIIITLTLTTIFLYNCTTVNLSNEIDFADNHIIQAENYEEQHDYQNALDSYKKALVINQKYRQHLVDENFENIANCHAKLGQYSDAEKVFLSIQNENYSGIARISRNLAEIYLNTGELNKAKKEIERSISIHKKKGSDLIEDLNILALIYDQLGEYDKSKKIYEDVLKKVKSKYGAFHPAVASSLNNLAATDMSQEKYSEAKSVFERALDIDLKFNDNQNIARDYNNLAILYKKTKDYEKSKQFYEKSLTIYEKLYGPEHFYIAATLNNLAGFYIKTHEFEKAEILLLRALIIAKRIKMPELQWSIQDSLRELYESQNQKSIAIYFGKLAVNTIQSVRSRITDLEIKFQKSFIKSKSFVYRSLVNILISQGRFSEAIEIIDLLKEAEYKKYMDIDFTRGSKYDTCNIIVPFNKFEQLLEDELMNNIFAVDRYEENFFKYGKLCGVKRYNEYKNAINTIQYNLQIEMDNSLKSYSHFLMNKDRNNQVSNFLFDLHNNLYPGTGNLSDIIVLHYIITKTHLNIIITTSNRSKGYQLVINSEELNKNMFCFKKQLEDKKEYLSLAQELYRQFFLPVAEDIEAIKPKIIMLSLDNKLRYIPMGALHDGKIFLAQKYMFALFYNNYNSIYFIKPKYPWTINAMGVSKQLTTKNNVTCSALPYVPQEINQIVCDTRQIKRNSSCIFEGHIWLDNEFTLTTLKDNIFDIDPTEILPVLHIASHFYLAPIKWRESYLLLGDAEILTLKKIENKKFKFHNIDLLTLSACNTATVSDQRKTSIYSKQWNGIEVDSFALLLLKCNARSVIGTLWKVNDESTSFFMQEFYKTYKLNEGRISKIQALQKSQMKFLGEINSSKPSKFSHPHYWAPFILFGNWR